MSVEIQIRYFVIIPSSLRRNLSPIPFANKLNLNHYPVGAPW